MEKTYDSARRTATFLGGREKNRQKKNIYDENAIQMICFSFFFVFFCVFRPTESLERRMMEQVSWVAASEAADWVGFAAEVASCPCSRPWLQREVDRWAFAAASEPAAIAAGGVVGAAFGPAASAAVAIALGLVGGPGLRPPVVVPNGMPGAPAAKPTRKKGNEKRYRRSSI